MPLQAVRMLPFFTILFKPFFFHLLHLIFRKNKQLFLLEFVAQEELETLYGRLKAAVDL